MFDDHALEEAGMETPPACGYLSRVVDLPIAVAEVVFDDVTQSLGTATGPDPSVIGTAMLPARRVRTWLRTPILWPAVPIEVELAPWSRGGSVVAVGFTERR